MFVKTPVLLGLTQIVSFLLTCVAQLIIHWIKHYNPSLQFNSENTILPNSALFSETSDERNRKSDSDNNIERIGRQSTNKNNTWRNSTLSFIEAEISEEEQEMMDGEEDGKENRNQNQNQENDGFTYTSNYYGYSRNNKKCKYSGNLEWTTVQSKSRRCSVSSSDTSDTSSSSCNTNSSISSGSLKRISISLERASCHFPSAPKTNMYNMDNVKMYVKFWKKRQEYCQERELKPRNHYYHIFSYDVLLRLESAVSEIEKHPRNYCEIPDETPGAGHQKIMNLAWKENLEAVVIDCGLGSGIVLKQEKVSESNNGQKLHLIKVYKVSNAPVQFLVFRFKRVASLSSTFRLHLNTFSLRNAVEQECIYTTTWGCIGA